MPTFSFRGDIIAVVGRSGSGKTTLLNLVSGIDRPDEGDIYLDGLNMTAASDLERTLARRNKTGFIFQFFNLIPTLTVWENLVLPLELTGQFNATGRKYATDLLAEVGLEGRAKAFPDRLSGGEQQRVAIARALVHSPALLLADEPTGNLDDDTGRQVLDLLNRLTRQAGHSMILVTHNHEAAASTDRIYQLRDGKLVNEGTP
jgi:putative ABC transport system ATP-binding protein